MSDNYPIRFAEADPAPVGYAVDVLDGFVKPDEVDWEITHRMRSTPLGLPSRPIRLQMYESNYRCKDYLRFDETIDPIQLARLFLSEFEAMLQNSYQPYPDAGGQSFDLRHLPLTRLKSLLPQSSNL